MKMTLKIEVNIKIQDDIKNEDNLQNEDILKNEDNTKNMASTALPEKNCCLCPAQPQLVFLILSYINARYCPTLPNIMF